MASCTPPFAITDAILTSSTAPEPGVGEVAWTSGATFAERDRAILGAPSATVTISIASPGVVAWTDNGLPDGTPVVLTTTGELPTGLTAGQIYYVVSRAADSFRLSAVPGGAPIVTTGSQSGTHTATASIHTVYESVADSNAGNPPAIDDGTKWIKVGPTNRHAMLDLYRSSKTWAPSPLTIVITPGQRIDSLFLGGLVADSVSVVMTVDGGEVYNSTRSLFARQTLSWRDYYFRPIERRASALLQDLPPYTGATVTVTITRAAGLVGCASLVIGQSIYLGTAIMGAEADAENFSKISQNEFGETELVPRRSVPLAEMTIRFESQRSRALMDLRERVSALPCVWSGLDDDTHPYFEPVLILGTYARFRLNLDQPDDALLYLTAREI